MINLDSLKELVNSLNNDNQILQNFENNPQNVVENFLGGDASLAEVSKVVSLIKENLGTINLEAITSNLSLDVLDTDGDGKFDIGDAMNLVGKFFKK